MDGMEPSAVDAPEKKKHRHRRHSSKRSLEGGVPSSADEPWMEVSKPASPSLALQQANETLEATQHAIGEVGGAGRQVYHEQLTKAQIALRATRDELGRAVREKEEEVGREHAKRERAEKEARREVQRHDAARKELQAALDEARKRNVELTNTLHDKENEVARAVSAAEREKAVLQDGIDEKTRVAAKYRTSATELQSALDEAHAAHADQLKQHEHTLADARAKMESHVQKWAAARLQNAAVRTALGRCLGERGRLVTSLQNAQEGARLLQAQLDGAASAADTGAWRADRTDERCCCSLSMSVRWQLLSSVE
jgi:chromosome segregation ATPase